MNRSYYHNEISSFLEQDENAILGILSSSNTFDLVQDQRNSWQSQISILKEQLVQYQGHIFFEFSIPRMGKRADVIVIIQDIIFILEFKVGSDTFDSSGLDQVIDYALDLKNFHKGSHDKKIVPILIATQASDSSDQQLAWQQDLISNTLVTSGSNLQQLINMVLELNSNPQLFNPADWMASEYLPTPTIIEAAQALYNSHSVEEISRTDAMNLSLTTDFIFSVMENSRRNAKKSICFVTGVPGAGKTLAGLNIATSTADQDAEHHAVFLSGNGPLVEVLREALARDQSERERITKKAAAKKVKAFIQNIHHFRDEYIKNMAAPIDKVVVFDEAQRAWSLEKASDFMKIKRGIENFNKSEPELLLSIMDRHKDWCTVVCLIGGGQELNTGEAGLIEWLQAMKKSFRHWDIYLSDKIESFTEYQGMAILKEIYHTKSDDLHLAVSLRSFRSEQLSTFVNNLIDNKPAECLSIYKALNEKYPIVLTRNLNTAKTWLKNQARGSERFGMVASSEGARLKAEGIMQISEADKAIPWYLNESNDVRSSYFLEEVATEFETQGLELDWTCVCWDADFRYLNGDWSYNSFRGTNWQKISKDDRKRFLRNAYRVILTRARQGIIIFIPKGDQKDHTRLEMFYENTYQYLKSCGIQEI